MFTPVVIICGGFWLPPVLWFLGGVRTLASKKTLARLKVQNKPTDYKIYILAFVLVIVIYFYIVK